MKAGNDRFLAMLDLVLTQARLAVLHSADANRTIAPLKALAIFELAKQRGLMEAAQVLPTWPFERSEYDALPVWHADDGTIEQCRMQICEDCWIVVSPVKGGYVACFKPPLGSGLVGIRS